MKVLYISDRQEGGIVNHVKCLTSCLPEDVDRYVIGVDGDEPFAGKNGHDWREWFQIRRVIKTFKPDIIHFHTIPLFMALYVKCSWFLAKAKRLFGGGGVRHVGVVCSIHTPSAIRHPEFSRAMVNWAAEPCYWLPVSGANWRNFKICYPKAQGEVFFNPVKLVSRSKDVTDCSLRKQTGGRVVGMVGRNAEVKDWLSFHRVAEIVQKQLDDVRFWNLGEETFCPNAREKIGEMDLMLLTSKTEEMPTVVLEAFAQKTPICGFIPVGGMEDILELSNGALREVFIQERDCEKLAKIVLRVLGGVTLQCRIVEDGWHILTKYFDAEKNVCGRLMEIYKKCCAFDGE